MRELPTYPYVDQHGTTWLDASGMLNVWEAGTKCFVCKEPTSRLDVCYEAPFCNSISCNREIADDLERLEQQPES